ncbi:hypothetical protein B0H16DRAFT_559328 [Mycena metata]|uniref:AAA-ATPase-like domain-containing protein n=1 Tax=Mycena metata TaxID=1033252 RepID=A0AAD7NG97_9AGAR|nr:hypothetical protein B0H16DRAFT_559328 [Mycena metata]
MGDCSDRNCALCVQKIVVPICKSCTTRLGTVLAAYNANSDTSGAGIVLQAEDDWEEERLLLAPSSPPKPFSDASDSSFDEPEPQAVNEDLPATEATEPDWFGSDDDDNSGDDDGKRAKIWAESVRQCQCLSVDHDRLPQHDAGIVAEDMSNAKPLISPPSTPSTRSTRKRSWPWSDDEESSSDGESDSKRTKRRSLSPISTMRRSGDSSFDSLDSSDHPHLPQNTEDFADLCNASPNEFVDKTQSLLTLPKKFHCLLLRPPRFGKTVLVSTLYHYYDVHGDKHFTRCFKNIAASHSDAGRSRHLCVSFDLTDIDIYSNIEEIASSLSNQISFTLTLFLIEYAKELHVSAPTKFLRDKRSDTFGSVFDLVKTHGYTLFVGVDNYDVPTQSRAFAHKRYPTSHLGFASARDIEQLLDSDFWRPLVAGTHIIDKLLITGTLHLRYPALESLDLSVVPSLESACGFTEQEAVDFARSFVEGTLDDTDLALSRGTSDGRGLALSCAYSSFPSRDAEGGTVQSILHPQLVIDQIYKLSRQPPLNPHPFQLLSDILELLPEESDVPAAVTIDGLIDLLATGFVKPAGKADSAFDFDPTTAVTWSALYYAGALTCDDAGTLRVTNSTALSFMHSRLDTFFGDRHQLQWKFLNAWYDFSSPDDDPHLLAELLSEVLRDFTQRTLRSQREPNLRGVLELVIQEGQRPAEPIILLPAHVTLVRLPSYKANEVLTVELTTVTLREMWHGAHPNDDEPTIEELQDLHKELIDLDEEKILERHCRNPNSMKSEPVGNLLTTNSPHRQILAVGGAHILIRLPSACI